MANPHNYPVDPMTAFYAAVTAVENGIVKEVELEFRHQTENYETVTNMTIRKELRPNAVFMPIQPKED